MNDRLMHTIFALLNMMGMAGVGTYLSGRKKLGVVQIVFSISFFALTLLPFMYFLHLIRQDEDNIFAWYMDVLMGNTEIKSEYFPPFLLAVLGVVLFVSNLVWSLTTAKPLSQTPPPLK